jgi:general secretion pathway protein M
MLERWRASPLAQRWEALPPRDRLALAGLGLFALLVLLYLAVWRPAERQRAAAQDYFLQQRDLNAYLESRAPLARNLQRRPQAQAQVDAAHLQGFVTSSAEEQGLAVERLDNAGEGVQVNLQPASFATLLQWFEQLQAQGVRITEAGLDRTADDRVTARLVLQAGS